MRRTAFHLAFLLVATPALAEIDETYRQWAAGPASHLFTSAERESWQAITSDEQADLFVRLFWAKRDSDPATPENEYRLEFEQRAAYADKQFATADLRGSMSDRGRTFVIFGPPYRVVRPASAGFNEAGDAGDIGGVGSSIPTGGGPGQFGTGGASDRAGIVAQETWVYEKDRKPKTITKTKLEVKFKSVPAKDQMVFQRPEDVLAQLAKETTSTIVRAELTVDDIRKAVPPPVAVATAWHAAPADPAQLAALDLKAAEVAQQVPAAPAAPTPGITPPPPAGSTTLDASLFQAADGTWIVPFQVSLPTTAAAGQRLLVKVTKADGSIAIEYLSTSAFETFGPRAYLQDTLVLPPDATYTLVAGLLETSGQVSFAATRPLVIPNAEPTFWVSDLLLSDNIYSLDHRQEQIESFSWNGVAVIPKGDNSFPTGTALWFYTHVCNPSLGPDGKPTLKTIVDLKGKRKFRGPMAIEATKANERCFVLAQAIDLQPQFVAGDYELKLEITDTTTNATASRSRPFSIPTF